MTRATRLGAAPLQLQRASALIWQGLLDQISQGVAMFDVEQRLVASNRQLWEVLGVAEALLPNTPTLEELVRFLGSRGDFGSSPDAVELAIQEHLAALDQPCLTERMLPDGRVLEFRRNPLPDGSFVVTWCDVTERRHAEYLLQDSARELRAILGKAPVALAVIGLQDRVLKHVNRRFRALFDLPPPAEDSGQTPLDLLISPSDLDRILSAQSDRRSVDFEALVRRADGGEFWALISSVRFIFEWEPATLTSFHDITDRKRAEAGLQEELERKRAELNEARTLQLELAPPPLRTAIGNFTVAIDVLLEPAKEVGGDLVDHFRIGDDLLVIVVGDVSNKGAGAALMMARAHSLIRGLAARPDAESLFRAPEQAIRLVNAALSKDNATCMFLTLFLGCLDAASGRLAYVRAGHVPPFLRRASTADAQPIERLGAAGGRPLGISLSSTHTSAMVDLAAGDQLLIVTDGITEAMDLVEQQFGEPRVAAFLSTVAPGEPEPLARLTAAVRTFEAGQAPFDDVAAIFVELMDVQAGVALA